LHSVTAAGISGYSMADFMALPDEERELLRSTGKGSNFGLIYGMGAAGYMEYARTGYGVVMTLAKAEENRNGFFKLYDRLLPWHDEYRAYAKKYKMVRSPLGRIRHLPLITSPDSMARSSAERQAVNSPVQSCLSDMMQLAMVLIRRQYGDAVQMFLMCHDSLAVYVPIGEEVMWAKRLKEIMENLPLEQLFGWKSPLKFYVDAESGPNLAELKKLKNL
jgi:DNA polymerase I-like protein with 3'-5' exonuclease and polymerase domains